MQDKMISINCSVMKGLLSQSSACNTERVRKNDLIFLNREPAPQLADSYPNLTAQKKPLK